MEFRNCNGEGETADDKAEAESDDDADYDNSSDEDKHDEVHHVQHPLMQLNDEYEYDPVNLYSMKLCRSISILSEYGAIDHMEEIDNLPDPRIYGIDVEQLHLHVLLFLAKPERTHPFHQYEQYMRHVDPVRMEYQVTVDGAWNVLHTEAEKHKSTPSLLSEPTLILQYLPTSLSKDLHQCSRQIMIAMEGYVRQIEPHFS